VVIPTYNRREHLPRALDSALRQTWPDVEILVVDDASTDGTEALLRESYPQVRYLRQPSNQGPGPARQRGIQQSRQPWVVMLDDDDVLCDDGLATMAAEINAWPQAWQYPILLFVHGNASLAAPFRVLMFEEYLSGFYTGDLLPVMQRDRYLAEKLTYPATRLGGEHLLFWQAALRCGIPAWNKRVGTVNDDAALRLTSVQQQTCRAREHAELQEATIAQFEDVLAKRLPRELRKRHLAAAVYWLLAGCRCSALPHANFLFRHGQAARALALWSLCLLPASWLRWAFVNYRRITSPNTYRKS
jgi:GalNAc5-diNAcBac-PP-undecaprenol beta-1,3-glucosyltransferase